MSTTRSVRSVSLQLDAGSDDSYVIAMKLHPDPAAVAWLEAVRGGTEDFDWDEGNRTKHRKHAIEPEHVEALFLRPVVFAGRIVEPAHDEPRWLLLGQDSEGRRLALIFTRRGQRVRPVSCRPMRRNERAVYEEAIRAEGG